MVAGFQVYISGRIWVSTEVKAPDSWRVRERVRQAYSTIIRSGGSGPDGSIGPMDR